jgi:hypothetical protein
MRAFLLGAGASRGTFGAFRVPVAAEFGRALATLDPRWAKRYPALRLVVEHLGLDPNTWPLEPVWSCIDYYAKLEQALPAGKTWQNESPELKKALLAVYGRRCDNRANRARHNCTLATLFRDELRAGDVLVSFNYDTIAERIARRCGHRLQAVRRDRGIVALAKPHGSTSWSLDLNSRSVTWSTPRGAPLLSSLTARDVDRRREPLLLGAVPIKSELIWEVQAVHRVPAVFNAIRLQWRAVVEAVRDADTIVVVGYSFPPEDQYGRFLVREGLRLRAKNKKVRIDLFEVDDKAAVRAREIRRVFSGHVRQIVFRGPVRP